MKNARKTGLVFATLVATLFTGCGGGDNTVTPNDPTVRSVPRTYAGLEFTLSLPKSTYAVGEDVIFTTTVKNTTNTTITVLLANSIAKDGARASIYDKNNVFVNYAPGITVPGGILATYTPGSSTSYTSVWHQDDYSRSQQVATGIYNAYTRLDFSQLNGQSATDADRDGLGSNAITLTIQ